MTQEFDLGTAAPPIVSPAPLADGAATATSTRSGRRRKRPPAVFLVSLGWLAFLVVLCIVYPLVSNTDPTLSDYNAVASAPGTHGHLLGTDEIGRDMLARLVAGTKISLIVGLGSVAVGCVIGAPLGICAGYFGKVTGRVIGAGNDIVLSFPPLIALIGLGLFLGPSLTVIIIGIGLVFFPQIARVAQSATRTYARRDFVTAARGLGIAPMRILRREILPNVIGPVLAYCAVLVGVAIIAEGGLSFLGLGVPPPTSSWGSMLGTGRDSLDKAPHIVLLPAAAMALTLTAFNFVAEYLTKRFDVRESSL